MITVVIYINGKPVRQVSAVRLNDEPVGECTYKIDETGEIIKHVFEKKASELAIKMLEKTKHLSDDELFKIHLGEFLNGSK